MRHELRIQNRSGHDTLVWDDTASPALVAEVEEAFRTGLKNGMMAYSTDEKGQDAEQVKTFDEAQAMPVTVLTAPMAGG